MMDPSDFQDIIRSVREFIDREVITREEEIEETDAVPAFLRQSAAEMGLFGYALPEEYGGLGFSMVEEAQLAFEPGRTTPPVPSMFGPHNRIPRQTLPHYGTHEPKRRHPPPPAGGAGAGVA